jgi:hypothetical protein
VTPPVRPFRLVLPLRPGFGSAEALRGAVDACLRAAVDAADDRAALALVAGELIDAAVSHGAWEAPDDAAPRCELRVEADAEAVRVSVERPVREGDPAVERLLAEVRRLAGAGSAEQAYVDRLRLLVAGVADAEALSIARIAHEGGCRVHAELCTDGVLRVVARRSLREPSP